MARCALCNDFEVGEGEARPCQTWVSKLLGSSCLYCRILVKALEELEPDYLTRSYPHLHSKSEQNPRNRNRGVELKLDIPRPGQLVVISHEDDYIYWEIGIQLFQLPEDRLQTDSDKILDVPVLGELSPLPGNPPMWAFLNSSLRKCLEEHTGCRESQDCDWWPRRLLLTRKHEGRCVVQLIDTKDHRPLSGYAALSHCWGSEQLTCTTSDNIRSHQDVITLTTLPRTFQDAITVAVKMNVAYLWIDSLCIIQGDNDDWAQHAEMMDKIYENALFVVAATCSSAGSVPFLGPGAETDRHTYRTVRIEIDVGITAQNRGLASVATLARKFDGELNPMYIRGPLEDRAWAYQESYCAVRLIRFIDTEVKWRCNTAAGCECHGALTMAVSKPLQSSDDKDIIFEQWRQVTIEFAGRSLSYGTDRLPALAGIASRFHARLGSKYIAGLWQDELPFNLKWYREDLTDHLDEAPLIPPAMDNGVPSWSWASNYGKCRWLWKNHFGPEDAELEQQNLVEVVQVDCVPSTANAFGEVRAGSFIELRGRVVQATMECDDFGRASVSRTGFKAQVVYMDCRTISNTGNEDREHSGQMKRDSTWALMELSEGANVVSSLSARYRGTACCLLLSSGTYEGKTQVCVLILGQTRIADQVCYQRLGIGCGRLKHWSGPLYHKRKDWALWRGWEDLEQWTSWKDWFAGAETRTMRII